MTAIDTFRDPQPIGNSHHAANSSGKIQSQHQQRLAIVYVRQSTPQQVLDHPESTALQYQLAQRAEELGWPTERVVVIDDDLGQSASAAVHRVGFQRLLAEIGLNHVGLVLGLEMSRLARSCKDWYQLLELCALFSTLLADQNGVYDPTDYNDRLLLGLSGMMSEAELHILRGRLLRGKYHKAERGELFNHPPMGYVRLPSGELALDPDQQVQSVIRLIFEKFDELGSARQVLRYLREHGIGLPVRPHQGPCRGQLEWHDPNPPTLSNLLRHPIYAGAYTYGRCKTDPRCKKASRPHSGRVRLPMDQWQVLRRDELPAYISWEQFLANQERLTQNRATFATVGAPREGSALLAGLVACGCCDWRMYVHYGDKPHVPRYQCRHSDPLVGEKRCPSLAARVIDDLVSRQVLQALQPAAVELSLQAADDYHRERERLQRHWQQQLERARFQTERARRQYDAVEPDNRLVARELEKRWEQTLREEQTLKEDYTRFQQAQPEELCAEDRCRIRTLAENIPTVWEAASPVDRQAIIRQFVERVVVTIQGETEIVKVKIQWVGEGVSEHEIARPVGRYELLRDYDQLLNRLVTLREAGYTSSAIAEHLNSEGFRSPKGHQRFNAERVRKLLCRSGLSASKADIGVDECSLESAEWWMTELAKALEMPMETLTSWCRKGWVHARKTKGIEPRWVIWADADEVQRLRQLRSYRRGLRSDPYPKELTTPKIRPKKEGTALEQLP